MGRFLLLYDFLLVYKYLTFKLTLMLSTEPLYRPTLLVSPSSDGINTSVTIQPPSPVVSSATIVNYQVMITGPEVEEMVELNTTIRYYFGCVSIFYIFMFV